MTTDRFGAVPAGRVLVVGGYGAVGAVVTATLSEWFPGHVVPGGRDEVRARRLGGVRVDVADPKVFRQALDELGDVAAVVLCVEPPDAGIGRTCLERGVHLVDVGVSPHPSRPASVRVSRDAAAPAGQMSRNVSICAPTVLSRSASSS